MLLKVFVVKSCLKQIFLVHVKNGWWELSCNCFNDLQSRWLLAIVALWIMSFRFIFQQHVMIVFWYNVSFKWLLIWRICQFFRWGGHLCVSLFCPSICLSICLSVRPAPDVRDHVIYHDFWYTCVNDGTSREGSGKWGKNGPKWQKKYVLFAPYLSNHTSYCCHFWYTCVKWYFHAFFHFFFNFDFLIMNDWKETWTQ